MGQIEYKSKADAEAKLNTTYANRVVKVFCFDGRGVGMNKAEKLDRISIDHRGHINMFFIDNTMGSLPKDEFFENIKILNIKIL